MNLLMRIMLRYILIIALVVSISLLALVNQNGFDFENTAITLFLTATVPFIILGLIKHKQH